MVLLEDVFPGVNELWLLFCFFTRYSLWMLSVSVVCYARSMSIYERERERTTQPFQENGCLNSCLSSCLVF